jgi:hypothetical protein
VHQVRLLFIQIGTKATQMRSIAQAIAQANRRGNTVAAGDLLALLVSEQRGMERLAAQLNVLVARLVD